MHRFTFVICFVLAFTFTPFSAMATQVKTTGTEVGRYAPPFELQDLADTAVSLESMKGSVVLLTFWSAHCPPCMAKMPSLNRLNSAMKDHGLVIISVAIDNSDETVREYVMKSGIGFSVLLDENRNVFMEQYQSPALPATYLIDQNGIIVEKFNGLAVWDAPEMRNRIMTLLMKR